VALGRFLDDGAIPIDNNLVERQHVRVALTRKNFLFVGSDAGGERAAVMYTLLGSCALNDVDPVAYLADVLPRLVRGVTPEEARELLPHRWKAARAPADNPPGPAAAEA
jgi:transposase